MIYPTKKLGEVCNITIGGTPRRGISKYWSGGELPWVSIADLSRNGREISETKERVTATGVKESNAKLLPKGTLLFSFKLSIGKVSFAGIDLYTNEAIAGLPIKNPGELDKNYLYYFLQQLDFSSAQKAVKGATLDKAKMQNIEIPVPPVEEQRKIVAKIEKQFAKIDEAARLRAESETLADELLPAALHEIFEKGKKNGWHEIQFGDTACIQIIDGDRGKNYPTKAEFSPSGYCLFLNTSNVRKGNFEFQKMDFISKEKDSNLRKGKVMRGDIILTTRGTLGNSAFYDDSVPFENVRINSGMVILRVIQTKILQNYLIYVMNSRKFIDDVVKANSGSAQPQLPIKVLSKISFPLPPLAEQKAIVKKLDALSEKARALRDLQSSQSSDLAALKQSILHEVFSGTMRT